MHCNEFICFTIFIKFLSSIQLQIVLVCSGCYDKNINGWLINNTHSFLIVLEAGKSKITALIDPGGAGPLPGRWSFDVTSHGVWRASFIRTVISFMELHPHDLIISQKSQLKAPSYWGLCFQHMNFGETYTFDLQHRQNIYRWNISK